VLPRHCSERKLEGIVSKRSDKPYVSGKNTDWIKLKCPQWIEENKYGGMSSFRSSGKHRLLYFGEWLKRPDTRGQHRISDVQRLFFLAYQHRRIRE
jgi:ATP-dependent DNA ligase